MPASPPTRSSVAEGARRRTPVGPVRKALLVSLLAVALLPPLLHAQSIDVFGYFEHQLFPQELGGTVRIQDYNRLRVDLNADMGEGIDFRGDVIYQTWHGATRIALADLLPDAIVRQAPPAVLSQGDLVFEDRTVLDHAYLSIVRGRWLIRAGKQPLPWGSGYTWNPTDLFNAKNVLDPTYEKEGVNALKVEARYGMTGLVTAVVAPGDEWDDATAALRVQQNLAGFDVAAIGAVARQRRGPLDADRQQRVLAGGNLSGQLFGLGIWGEGAWNRWERDENYFQVLAGADYTLADGLYLIGEYYFNGPGRSGADAYRLADWLRLLGEEGENLGRHYGFGGAQYPLTDLVTGAVYGLANTSDGSAVLFPWIDWSLSDEVVVSLVGYLPVGGDNSEFGSFGAGGFARLRAYF